MPAAAHVYEIFVKAPPERVWQALIDPEFTRQYFHGTRFESEFGSGAPYRNVLDDGRLAVDGVIEEFDPPHRLVMTWHVLYDAAMAAEPPGRVEWLLRPANDDASVTRVTLRHGDLALSPLTWEHVRLGWVEIIDGLKTLLETGEAMPGVDARADAITDVEGHWHRTQGIAAFNSVWELLEDPIGSPPDVDELLSRAYASAYHWSRASGRGPENAARASWILSRCHVVLGHGDLALHHADRCMAVVLEAGLEDFDRGYAHEARARALALLGRLDDAATELDAARTTTIDDPEDRAIFEGDLAAPPWFDLPVG